MKPRRYGSMGCGSSGARNRGRKCCGLPITTRDCAGFFARRDGLTEAGGVHCSGFPVHGRRICRETLTGINRASLSCPRSICLTATMRLRCLILRREAIVTCRPSPMPSLERRLRGTENGTPFRPVPLFVPAKAARFHEDDRFRSGLPGCGPPYTRVRAHGRMRMCAFLRSVLKIQ